MRNYAVLDGDDDDDNNNNNNDESDDYDEDDDESNDDDSASGELRREGKLSTVVQLSCTGFLVSRRRHLSGQMDLRETPHGATMTPVRYPRPPWVTTDLTHGPLQTLHEVLPMPYEIFLPPHWLPFDLYETSLTLMGHPLTPMGHPQTPH